MNNRIKEIALKAGMSECQLGYGMPENVLWGEKEIERFAQMIIEDIFDICEGQIRGYKDKRKKEMNFEDKNMLSAGETACETTVELIKKVYF